jgi:pimeloyl-ACP methyl ester carboxylesterase
MALFAIHKSRILRRYLSSKLSRSTENPFRFPLIALASGLITGQPRRMLLLRLISLVFVSLLLGAPAISAPTESNVKIAPDVMGTLATGSVSPPQAVVLLLHGWTGNRDELGNMFKRTAAQLAEQNIASLRIDFRGEGERNAHRLTSTFATRIADAEAGLSFLQQRYPNTKIGVLGFSLGGATALAVVGRQPDAVQSLVLWSTAGDIAVDFFTDPSLKPASRKAMEKGEAVFDTWAKITLTREHLMGMIGYDLFTPLGAYQGALLSIRGSADYLTPYENRILAAANGTLEEAVTIGGADHIYNTLDPTSTHDERAITLTVRWFNETL